MKNKVMKYAWLLMIVLPLGFFGCGDDDPEPDPADKTALMAKITDAEAIIADAEVGKLAGMYTQESVDAFQTAIDAANAVNDDDKATQEQVDATTSNLQLAIDTFEDSVIVEISEENLVAYWKMDGDGVDASGKSHDGTLMPGTVDRFPDGGTAPTATTDRYGDAGMALHFAHGANIEVPFSNDLNPDQMTISIWLNADSLSSAVQYIMSLDIWNTWKFELPSHGEPFLTRRIGDDNYLNYDSDVALEPLNWYQVVVSTDQTAWSFYINGVLAKKHVLETDTPPVAADPEIDFVIGSFLPNDGDWTHDSWFTSFHGSLDDARIYNKALTAAEVSALYGMESVD